MRVVIAVAAATVLSTAAIAQSNTGTGSGTENPAINIAPSGSPERTGALAPGANSFTEGQARSRIEAQGFSSVSGLHKDDKGIWRGTAQRDGRSVDVMLDYQGHVASK